MRRMMLTSAVLVALTLAGAAQQAPRFEVASVKPQTDPRPPRAAASPDRFIDPDTTLRGLIEYAYELTEVQVIGGPDWIGSQRFAIDAKAAGTPTRAEMRLMVRALLAQRFNLNAHTETREMPVYILERVRPDGPLGPALRVTPSSECATPAASTQRREPGGPPPCGAVSASPVRMSARGVAMNQFARNIMQMGGMTGVDRIVIDRTGLGDRYSFEFSYRPTETSQLAGGADNPSMFDALREQLGLKLTPTRAPISVLVIDSVERPTPN